MQDMLERLYQIARAYGIKNRQVLKELFETRGRRFFDGLGNTDANRLWEEFISSLHHQKSDGSTSGFENNDSGKKAWEKSGNRGKAASSSDTPVKVAEDLALFGLTPPSSLNEIRKARNREIKKYHSDRFINDPEQLEVSKEIMQIYNTAYERLRIYYEKGSY